MAKRKKEKSLLANLSVMGLGFITVGITLAIIFACLSYDNTDSGYNIASSAAPRNWLGMSGAYVSSLILSWSGVALPIFLIAPLVWGYEIIRYKTFLRPYSRIFAFLFGSVCLSSLANLIVGTLDGFKTGGNIGAFFSREFLSLSTRIYDFAYNEWILAAMLFILTFVSFNFACGITPNSWYRLMKKILSGFALCLKNLIGGSKKIGRIFAKKETKITPSRAPRHRQEPKLAKEHPSSPKSATPATAAKKIAKPDDGYIFPDIELLSVGKDKNTQHVSQKELDKILKQMNDAGDKILDDNNGGYIVIKNGEQYHIYKTEKGFQIPVQEGNMSAEEFAAGIESMNANRVDVSQRGDNFTITKYENNVKHVLHYTKQEDGSYTLTDTSTITEIDSFSNLTTKMIITGDNSGQVVLNNKIDNFAEIDISGTNVDVNKGAGTIYRTITYDKGVTNINAGARAEDNIINLGGTMNVANAAEISRTEINQGGVLNVAAGGYAEDTTVNSGGQLNAKTQARLNNLLANGGAILDIDSGAVLTGNIVMHADAQMGGTYDYSSSKMK